MLAKQVKRSRQHNLKLIRKFDEDIFVKTPFLKKPSNVLNYIFESHQNNYKYRRLLRKNRLFFQMFFQTFLKKKKEKFVYRVFTGEKEFQKKKNTLKKSNYFKLLKLRCFYGNIGKRKFKKIFLKAKIKSNYLRRSFAYFLESRVDVILYRANFFSSIFTAKQYISHGNVYVNGALVTKPGFKISINDIITVKDYKDFYSKIKARLRGRKILVNYPKYLEVNYRMGSVILTKLPVDKEVPFPFFMNLKSVSHKFLK